MMMNRFFALIILLLSSSAYADSDRVAIVVNKQIITEREIFNRKNLIIKLQNLTSLGAKEHEYISSLARQTLIDEILLKEDAERHGVVATDADVKQFILDVEKDKKLQKGYFASLFANSNLYPSFFGQMRTEYIKSRLSHEVFIRRMNVAESEVDDLAVNYAQKDLEILLREFSINDQDDKSYKILKKIQTSAKNCSSKVKESKLKQDTYLRKLSELTQDERELIDNVNIGKFSAIVEKGASLSMYQVCSRKVISLTGNEAENISSMIGNRKLILQFMKYIETLRKKAYIKTM